MTTPVSVSLKDQWPMQKKRIKVSESKIREIIGLYGNNLWKVLEEIDNSEER